MARIAKRVERFDRSIATPMRTAMALVALNAGEGQQPYDSHGRRRMREVDVSLRVAHAFEDTSTLDEALVKRLDWVRARLWKLAR